MPIPPANLIDIGTDEDAGFWSDALRFAPFPHTDYPVPFSIQARATGRRGVQTPPVRPPAAPSVFAPVHAEPNATEVQQNPDAR